MKVPKRLLFSFIAAVFIFFFSSAYSYAQYCPDAFCNGVETCSTCPQDCGACPTPGCFPNGGACTSNPQCCTNYCSSSTGLCNNAPTPTPTPIPTCGAILSGAVYNDSGGNNCSSGTAPYSGATVTIYNGGSPVGNGISNGAGAYSATDSSVACANRTAVISGLALGYTVKRINFNLGGWTSSGLSGFTYGPFPLPANRTLDWCVSSVTSWLQITDGDVRFPNLVDNVPPGQSSTGGNSACFSSSAAAVFGAGSACTWNVSSEYSFNDEPKTRNGLLSYTFFINRSRVKSVDVTDFPDCPTNGTPCTTAVSGLATGQIYRSSGNLTINSYSHTQGHTLILVNGDLTIKGSIVVAQGVGNLLIIAAKGNIKVDPAVGIAASGGSSSTKNLQGFFTAEGNITLESVADSCSDGSTSDLQLNLAGGFVANAQKPFKTGGTGKFINNRSLCANDSNYPSFTVVSRNDFIPQLTDFYKIPSVRWREVNP